MKKTITYTGPMRLAHRGLAQVAPENTLGAFQGAVDQGYEGIEIDIQISKDGEIIVAHDSNFTRMTLGHPTAFSNRRLCEMTWDEISRMELPYANHMLPASLPSHTEIEEMAIMPNRLMGQERNRDYETALTEDGRMAHLIRFQDFDAWLTTQKRDVTVEIEVKTGGLVNRMLEILDKSPNVGHYILFSGVPAYNAEIQETCKKQGKPDGLRLGANLRFMNDETRRAIREWDLFEIGLNADRFTQADVLWLQDHGVAVFSNLGDYTGWWEKLCKMNVLGFKTNYAEAFTKWWRESYATI